ALVLAAAALVFRRAVHATPEQAKIAPLPPELNDHEAAEITSEGPTTWSDLRPLFTRPAIWIAGAMYFFLKLTRYAYMFWLPVYLTEALHYSTKDAGNLSAGY